MYVCCVGYYYSNNNNNIIGWFSRYIEEKGTGIRINVNNMLRLFIVVLGVLITVQ